MTIWPLNYNPSSFSSFWTVYTRTHTQIYTHTHGGFTYYYDRGWRSHPSCLADELTSYRPWNWKPKSKPNSIYRVRERERETHWNSTRFQCVIGLDLWRPVKDDRRLSLLLSSNEGLWLQLKTIFFSLGRKHSKRFQMSIWRCRLGEKKALGKYSLSIWLDMKGTSLFLTLIIIRLSMSCCTSKHIINQQVKPPSDLLCVWCCLER